MPKPYQPNDILAQKARKENFRARSVYKLQELDAKYHLIQPGMHVLDVAAAPGSWMQYTVKKLGPNGHVLGLDLQEIEAIAGNVTTVVCDISNDNEIEKALADLGWVNVDLVLSDIAPSTTGISELDHGRSIDLNTIIYKAAKKFLKPGGRVVMKVFEGSTFQDFIKELRRNFKKVVVTKAKASRDRSKELYVICQ
jgi:23S rRNA (uridine2552-2'-O)-methyltransferase